MPLGLQVKPQMFSPIVYEKYTHEPFESKCFLSSFIESKIGVRWLLSSVFVCPYDT